MRARMRWVVVVVVVLHGLIHLLGAAKGLGWADVTQLAEPIRPAVGVAWLAAALLVVAASVLLIIASRWWWVVGAVAVVVSQAVIFTSWGDAKAGTLANVVLLVAFIHGYASQGPTSYRAEYRRRAATALTEPMLTGAVTEADLTHLPEPVAAYLRRSGAVGQPRVTSFHARVHGRIRGGASKPWMSFTGEQVNTYGSEPSRFFFIDATMFGLPVDVFHDFVGGSARMRVKVFSLVPMVNATGPQMDRGETVTLFNDLCVLAPAALVDAPVSWQYVDDRHVRGTFTNGAQTVTADLAFNDDCELVGFVSDDRLRASENGRSFTPQRWSTPLTGYRTIGSRRIASNGRATGTRPTRRASSLTSSSTSTTSPTTRGPCRPAARGTHRASAGHLSHRQRCADHLKLEPRSGDFVPLIFPPAVSMCW
jgi:hypothetical protein